jgi:hypothetical protein
VSSDFIMPEKALARNGWLGNGLQRDDSRDTCPIIEANWHCCCRKTSLGLYCWNGWKKTVNSVSRQRHRFATLNDIYDLVLGCFYNIVIKPPDKL